MSFINWNKTWHWKLCSMLFSLLVNMMLGGNRWRLAQRLLNYPWDLNWFLKEIHSSTSKGLYNFFNIQSFWVNQITDFLIFFYSFFGLNYAKFFNDLILYADMIQCQNTKPNKSWCFLKKKLVLLMHLQVKKMSLKYS